MRLTKLPILLCWADCPKCGLPTEFKMFESGSGGDFATYMGDSGAIYRLDLGKVWYQGKALADLLAPAMKKEGNLKSIPDDVACKLCGTVSSGRTIGSSGEQIIEAYEL
jgi:hypothetical protein